MTAPTADTTPPDPNRLQEECRAEPSARQLCRRPRAVGRALVVIAGVVVIVLGRKLRDYVDHAEHVIRTGLAELEHKD
ncbi:MULTISPECIES: hypothetical protein [unclassified Crossiella]|uniref:hypothetical protein n=1 Tax=unclassified Crossiella TaxID=2620835 RepID=UPI0020002AEE|nr:MULTISPECIES: hypothetical protein [unclassified Crossiella]MCK2239406.1 hypothetical protein [Crossiella sp. S99.2]MCK2252101.1 hypothetical protein [Crossiella sp. S99.1]